MCSIEFSSATVSEVGNYGQNVVDIADAVAIGIARAVGVSEGTDHQEEVIDVDCAIAIGIACAGFVLAGVFKHVAATVDPSDPDVVGIIAAEQCVGDEGIA